MLAIGLIVVPLVGLLVYLCRKFKCRPAGFLDNFQFACSVALSLWGVPKTNALPFAMVYFFLGTCRTVLLIPTPISGRQSEWGRMKDVRWNLCSPRVNECGFLKPLQTERVMIYNKAEFRREGFALTE